MMKKVLLGAGCFWGVDHILKKINGIHKTQAGYSGGTLSSPTYQEVCTGVTGHAEVVYVEYDETILSFKQLLDIFFRLHDPTTLNRQHNDVGTQYRSAIFCESEDQLKTAKEYIEELNTQKAFPAAIVTEVAMIKNYYSAENYHQDYLIKNPDGYMCHILREKL